MIEEPSCIDAILHPLLKTLEVTQDNLSLVLENYHNVPNITYLTLCFDIRKQGSIEPQLLTFNKKYKTTYASTINIIIFN